MSKYKLVIAILATWRLSALLVYDYGPFDIFEKLRQRAGVYYLGEDGRPITFWGKFLKCLWCVSVWIGTAITCALCLWPWFWWLLLPFALSGGAVLLNEYGDVLWQDRV